MPAWSPASSSTPTSQSYDVPRPPKLNVLNTALMSAVVGDSFDDARADRSHWGRVVESAVGAHLVNTASSATVRYWRDGHEEIDFVLQRGPRLVGIEVKAGRGLPRRSSLKTFERRFSAPPSIGRRRGGRAVARFPSGVCRPLAQHVMSTSNLIPPHLH